MTKRRVFGRVFGMKYSWKGHKDRNWHKNGINRNGARLVYVKALTATSPARDGEPVGTADTSRLDYIRWRYDADTEKERPTQPSCIILDMTRRGQHWRLYHAEIQIRRHTPLVLCSIWLRERQTLITSCMVFSMTAILCEAEVSTEIQTLSYCIMTMSMTQRQTLPSRVVLNMTQRQTTAVLCGVEYDREANSDGSVWRDDERDAQV